MTDQYPEYNLETKVISWGWACDDFLIISIRDSDNKFHPKKNNFDIRKFLKEQHTKFPHDVDSDLYLEAQHKYDFIVTNNLNDLNEKKGRFVFMKMFQFWNLVICY